jgi:glycosyltransferase involved in cell wall biosynthesis
VEGIEELGFVQPDKLPALMKQAGALVLASRREPWGVVVHEAATAGLPILCADVAGAAVHLVQDGFNGVVFEAGNARHLAQGMERMTRLSVEERAAMGRRSHLLSTQFTPQRWADTLVRGVASIRSNAR